MPGFFLTEKELQPLIGTGCIKCHLDRGCSSPKMPPSGKGEKGLLVIAEAPGRKEDEEGIQLIGKAGQIIRRSLKKVGIDLDRDCRKTNAVICRPPKNRTPTDKEIQACRPHVWKEIKEFCPKVILICGGAALESFLGHRWNEALGGINRWRGWAIPDREVGAWVVPTFHPSYIDRNKNNPAVSVVFERDIQRAVELLEVPFPQYEDEMKAVKIIDNDLDLRYKLESLYREARKEKRLTAFDYETTGLKPYKEGHRIVSASICLEYSQGYSFMFPPHDSEACSWFTRILETPSIPKTAHNIKFEDTWSVVALNARVRNWKWCSMQAAHILDNRPKVSGLDFQAYVNFGLLPWGGEVTPYLKSPGGGNEFNKIDKAPRRKLLEYGGIDSLVQYRLAIKQMEEILT